MSLQQNTRGGKQNPTREVSLGIGNIVPHYWYKSIKAPSGKPDLVAITVLSELWFLHRKSGGAEFNAGYANFERKFDFSRSQLKDAMVRLHDDGLLRRSFRALVINGRTFPNELHLALNIASLLAMLPNGASGGGKSGGSSFSQDMESSNSDDGEIFHGEVFGNSVQHSLETPEEHIRNRKISLRKNRSLRSEESSFKINDLKEELDSGSTLSATSNSVPSPSDYQKLKPANAGLGEFYPLEREDIAALASSSGREFGMNAVNEILLKLSKSCPDHSFPNKAAFMSYMSKVLRYEKRDAVRINNAHFRIRSNMSETELATVEQERFLAGIENIREVSPLMHLKKKLASVLAPDIAAPLLRAFRSIRRDGDVCKIYLSRQVELTDLNKELILNQVKATHEGLTSGGAGMFETISRVEIISPQPSAVAPEALKPEMLASTTQEPGIWGQVRARLIEYFGADGVAIDQNWFSRLRAEIDDNSQSLTLKTSSEFFRDWITSHYRDLIERFCKMFGFEFAGVVV
ncbi:MAG: hypothetical protein COA94_03320 [Rickettsiales bacterium]|nr:MAG: hypothetical protein COA94_03320 [Rickettsiales bacterium]